METCHNQLWGLVMAGGDGKRLSEYVASRLPLARPKQFCVFSGTRSMLSHTLGRIESFIPRHRLVLALNEKHLVYASCEIEHLDRQNIVAQPENKDTAPGLLYSLLHIFRRDANAVVAVFPADHFIRPEEALGRHIEAASAYIEHHPTDLVLIGVEPNFLESDYGWIEPGCLLDVHRGIDLFSVRNFVEKPPLPKAVQLARKRGFWNTMIMVGTAAMFLSKFRRLSPHLYSVLSLLSCGPTPDAATRKAYREIPSLNFSVSILERDVSDLVVLAARGMYWSDWGRGDRIDLDLALLEAEKRQARTLLS
jgi:mannose-1-phosphate guanylyltransferase